MRVRPVWLALGVLGCADPSTLAPEADPAARMDTGDTGAVAAAAAGWSMTVLNSSMTGAFEIVEGPDNMLWVTERTAGEVTRLDTTTGAEQLALTVPDVLITPGTQDGLMGMALHPQLLKGSNWVYLAYTYDADADPAVVDEKVKIVRYTFKPATGKLVNPRIVLAGIPGSTDHNSGRLLFGPDGKLYYTVGDQGSNQFARYCDPIEAQTLPTRAQLRAGNLSAYKGKILRIEPDGKVPLDNPTLGGIRSHVYTIGHRNPQGLAFGADGTLYSSEQGPKSDDEINVVTSGGNYGWPHVAGHQDDLAYVYGNWSASVGTPCEDLEFSDYEIPPSVPVAEESSWSDPAFQPPARTLYTVADDYDFQDPACAEDGLYFICWPTIAVSSIAAYEGYRNPIPEIDGSLLVTSLKLGTLYRVDLRDAAGVPIPDNGDPEVIFSSVDRYRRVVPSRNGRKLYVATDNSGVAMGADGTPTFTLEHPGSILVLTHAP